MDVTSRQDQEDLDTPPAEPRAAHSGKPLSAAARSVQFASRYSVIGIWFAMIAVYAVAEPGVFLTKGTFQTVFGSQQSLVFLTMALLCTVCVGEFVDLSVPAVFGFSATILPVLVVEHGWGVWQAAVVALLGALAAGVVNGLLVVVVGVNTIVVTLGMGTLLGGISLWLSHLNTVSGLPTGFGKIALYSVAGLPISFYYGAVLVTGFAYLLGFTPLGRHIRFVGANREVSRLSGIRVDRIRFGSFVTSGALCGVGAIIAVAALGGYNPTTSDSLLLPTFASVFLGTAIVAPGRFNPIGTFVGIYFLATGILGLQLLGLEAWVSSVFYGGVLVAAVTVATLLRRRSP